jgi:hypothetical protein
LVYTPVNVTDPWFVGFPVCALAFAPMHTKSPILDVSVWLTITVPNAPNGHGDTRSERAVFARRIQYTRVLYGMPLIARVGDERTVCKAWPSAFGTNNSNTVHLKSILSDQKEDFGPGEMRRVS